MPEPGRNDLNVARPQLLRGGVFQRRLAAHAGTDGFRGVLVGAVHERPGQLRAGAFQHVVDLGDLVVAQRSRIGPRRPRHHRHRHVVLGDIGERHQTVVDRHARRERRDAALDGFLNLRVREIRGPDLRWCALRDDRRDRQNGDERKRSNNDSCTHDYSFASRASKRMFRYVIDLDCLMPCGTPGGMNTRSPALISRSMPPRMALPLNSPAAAPGFASTSVPPVATIPEPSRTTQTSVIRPCCSAVSDPEMWRTLMLNTPPSSTRWVISPFAVMSFATASSAASGRSIALSFGAGGAPAVCADAGRAERAAITTANKIFFIVRSSRGGAGLQACLTWRT